MKAFSVRSDHVWLGVTETGAHLSDVTFALPDGRRIAPMHTAPWAGEPLADDIPPILRVLRGDFLCAPFSTSDVIAGEQRPHGTTANGQWRLERSDDASLEAILDGDVMGARVALHLQLRRGETMVYQRHTFAGGNGRLPVGHHAMLRADQPLHLSFSPFQWAGTPPDPVEVPPAGHSLLAYPQRITDPGAAALADGGRVDLTTYPFADGHEDLWMLSSSPGRSFAWTAAACPGDGWVWFALKDPRVLPSTVFWLSNGGRGYAPWSSRHRRVIGLEEVCSYFHLGHAASIADNPLSKRGIPTAVTLEPDGELVINYAFGLAAIPAGFDRVASIEPAAGGVMLTGAAGHRVFAACDISFLTSSQSTS